jgi:LPPG:FO 2-phospho-L-lactate transferase
MKSDLYDKGITLISGGVGGAKLAGGFVRAFPEQKISVITNTADDTEFYGLHVSPDIDTMMYTLAGLSGAERGWGIKDDTFHSLDQMGKYGEAAWFKLGDRDMATHILRTKMLREGKTLTQVTSHLSRKLGVRAGILPMTNQRVETFIRTDDRTIPFQEYFILRAGLLVFAPSNPIVSVLPILSLPGIRQSIMASPALKVAVSPFIGKEAVSGPAKELMESKGFEGSSTGMARFYVNLIDLLFIHRRDKAEKEHIEQFGVAAVMAETIMKNVDSSVRLAQKIYEVFSAQRG